MTRRSVIIAAGLLLAACGAEPAVPTRTVTVEDARPSVGDVTDEEIAAAARTSLDSAMVIARDTVADGGNLVISPAALSYSLAIAQEGSACEASEEIAAFIGGSADTYRHLAAMLASSDDEHYQTRLTGLVLHMSGGRADDEALESAAQSFAAAYASVPNEEMTGVADQWLNESTRGSASRIPMPLAAGADAAVLTAAHYETAWALEVSALTAEFEFADGRLELVPALDIGSADAWRTDQGMVIELPTASPDPTYVYYPDEGVDPADLTADDWQITGERVPTAVVLPAVSASSSVDIDSHRTAAGLSGLAEGGECGLSGFGETASVDFGSGHAAYDIAADGISAHDSLVFPDQIAPDETIPENTITIDRPFALLTADGDTGWAITYAIINDPTR